MTSTILIGGIFVLACTVVYYFYIRRVPEDVLHDLSGMQVEEESAAKKEIRRLLSGKGERRRLVEVQRKKIRGIITVLIYVLGGIALGALIGRFSNTQYLVAFGIIGLGLGIMIEKALVKRAEQRWLREIEFHLPMVMERIVMAAHAGLDIIPALRSAIGADCHQEQAKDPVSQLLSIVVRLTESGLLLEDSLKMVAEEVPSSALRHAFIYLGVSHSDGGQIVAPLRELSDATQRYYEESLEEDIAKLPVRATIPLILTFAGLLLIFLSAPLVQVLDVTKRSAEVINESR